jgi:hypothetical protein
MTPDSGHQNGHQKSKKVYRWVMPIYLESPMESGILELQRREI